MTNTQHPGRLKAWIEAMRLRTLPVSTSGVIAAWALAINSGNMRWLPALICLVFAVLCQIVSNFANEYYDYKDGLDRPGRSGPRRGVTEGDIAPSSMKAAAYCGLFLAMLTGLWLIYWSGPWLIIVGIVIALGAMAYSTGPFPLSRHGLGEVAVLLFFGIIPVNFTYYLCTGSWNVRVALLSLAIGLMAANVLIVNNYRDAEEDAAVGKKTLANICGRRFAGTLYLMDGVTAFLLALSCSTGGNKIWIASVVYIALHLLLWSRLKLSAMEDASKLNPLLGLTAMAMLVFSLLLFI